MTEGTNVNSIDGSDSSDDAGVGNSFSCKMLVEMELLEQRDFDDEDGSSENNDENK